MKTRFQAKCHIVFVSLALVFLIFTNTAFADFLDIPVQPGESFHWIFVTSVQTTIYGSDISLYDAFVNGVADAADHPISGIEGIDSFGDIEWRVIGSTTTTDASDHIISPPFMIVGNGCVMYNLYGDQLQNVLAFANENFTIGNPVLYDEYGNTTDTYVWTGTSTTGQKSLNPLDDNKVTIGSSSLAGSEWINCNIEVDKNWGDYSFYAISEELTAAYPDSGTNPIPAPGAILLGSIGAGIVAHLRRRKTI